MRGISRRGPTEWPARSADLKFLDYFSRGFMGFGVYANRSQNCVRIQLSVWVWNNKKAQIIPTCFGQWPSSVYFGYEVRTHISKLDELP